MRRVLEEGSQVRQSELELPRIGGWEGPAVVDLIAYPVEFGDSRYVAVVLRDVTRRYDLERQARQAEAMEATVTLARGVAHDFSNLLTSAIGTLSLLDEEQGDGPSSERVRRALRACWQAAGLSRRLLGFARSDHGNPQVVCLRDTVSLILESFDESFLQGIRLRIEGEGPTPVLIDTDQLTQIVLNLLVNAREAMTDGGDLRVRVEPGKPGGSADEGGPNTHAVLTVSDTGAGISPEVKDRLFEPFFTTKPRASQRSRGMGLAIVYAAVKNAGGFIEVDSQPGAGTTFRVYLPLGERAATQVVSTTEVQAPQTGSGTILLVEDEPLVLQACAEALSSWGYTVVAAESAREAQQKFVAAGHGPFGLAIIDMHLPDGTGIALAQELSVLEPELRFIFTSGLPDEEIPPELGSRVCTRLTKPFRFEWLATSVSSALMPRGSLD
jgi:two-component system cell cycle sensor histidine kinase/response regulator CckA